MARDYIIDVIDSEKALEQIVPEWLALWREAEHATPFQSPQWNLAWWRHLRRSERLAVVALRYGGALTLLAPWLIVTEPNKAGRILRFLGSGVSDHLDVLRRPGSSTESVSVMLRRSLEELVWDKCDFDELRPDSPLMDTGVSGLAHHADPGGVCLILQLHGSGTALERCIPKGAVRVLGYYRRRAAHAHDIEIESSNERNFEHLLAELFRLHSQIWSSRGQSGVLCGPEITAFHQEAAYGLLREGSLRLYLLTIDGVSAAAFYGFQCHRRSYYYLGGFNPAFASLNPGTLVVGYAIEQAIHEGSLEFDFLRGNEPYKYWWGAQDRPNYRLRIGRDSMKKQSDRELAAWQL